MHFSKSQNFLILTLQFAAKEQRNEYIHTEKNAKYNSLSFIKLNDEKQGSSEVQWSKYGVHQVLRRRGGAKIEGWSLTVYVPEILKIFSTLKSKIGSLVSFYM